MFAGAIERWRLPSVSYGVVAGGRLIHDGASGRADLATDRAPDRRTVFRIASMTKSFTAASVLSLRDEGALALDDPVTGLVPELRGLRYPSADSAPVTYRMLLSMSSGLVEDDPWGDRLLDLPREAFAALLEAGVGFDRSPGTAYEYSNLGYAVLGLAVERCSGTPLRELARRRLLDPLGMASTTWDADRLPPGSGATGYRLEQGSFVLEPSLGDGAFGAMGGLASSVEDLARWVAFHLSAWPPRDESDEGPLRRASLREMAHLSALVPSRHLAPPPGSLAEGRSGEQDVSPVAETYGFGLVASMTADGVRAVGHAGGLPGFGSYMQWLPDHGVGVVALANRTYAPMRRAVWEAMAALRSSASLVPIGPAPVAELAALPGVVAGLYESGDSATISPAMLDTYYLDRDDDRRPPDLSALHAELGPVLGTGPVRPTGRLRGSWTMRCQGGDLELTAILGPTLPPRVQFLEVRVSRRDGSAGPAS